MSKLTAAIGAALRDARRAEAILREPGGRRAFAKDPDERLSGFELRRLTATPTFGTREARMGLRDGAVRLAGRTAAS